MDWGGSGAIRGCTNRYHLKVRQSKVVPALLLHGPVEREDRPKREGWVQMLGAGAGALSRDSGPLPVPAASPTPTDLQASTNASEKPEGLIKELPEGFGETTILTLMNVDNLATDFFS